MSILKRRRFAEEDETVNVSLELPVEEAIDLAEEISEAVEGEVDGIVEDVKEAMLRNKFSHRAMAHALHRLNKAGILVNVPKQLQGQLLRLSSREAALVNRLVKEVEAATEAVLTKAARVISKKAKSTKSQARVASRVDKTLLKAGVVRSTLAQPIEEKRPSRVANTSNRSREARRTAAPQKRKRSILDTI